MRFRWRKEFYDELERAGDFYRQRNTAAMRRLFNEFGRTLARIARNPTLGEKCGSEARRSRVFGFPFDVIYMRHADAIILIALAHHSRRPGYWKGRLQS